MERKHPEGMTPEELVYEVHILRAALVAEASSHRDLEKIFNCRLIANGAQTDRLQRLVVSLARSLPAVSDEQLQGLADAGIPWPESPPVEFWGAEQCKCFEIEAQIRAEFPGCDWNFDEACGAWHRRSRSLGGKGIKENCACLCPACGRSVCDWCEWSITPPP